MLAFGPAIAFLIMQGEFDHDMIRADLERRTLFVAVDLSSVQVEELPGNPEHQPPRPPVRVVDERVEIAIHERLGIAPEIAVR